MFISLVIKPNSSRKRFEPFHENILNGDEIMIEDMFINKSVSMFFIEVLFFNIRYVTIINDTIDKLSIDPLPPNHTKKEMERI